MSKRHLSSLLAAAAIAALLPMLPVDGVAQSDDAKTKTGKTGKGGGKQGKNDQKDTLTPAGPTPRMPDRKVDLSGVWTPGLSFTQMGQVPLQPWAAEVLKQRRDTLSKDDPEGHCLPAGVPRISPFLQKFVQTPTLLVILDEGNIHSYRQVFLDGRPHLDDPGPLWMGDSIGKWDGDTLVVDTINLNDKTWLNGQGVPHSEDLHVVERFRRPDLGHLEIEITMEDAKTFTKPHTFTRTYLLRPTWEIQEYVCNEFNVDADHLVGK
ncbi:MAG: hypothetical protein JWO19_3160 [Bryobacterales bacterium]|jgi:hypothetical protein|nr:hypothetical protein [Bryobacterales bacterium]